MLSQVSVLAQVVLILGLNVEQYTCLSILNSIEFDQEVIKTNIGENLVWRHDHFGLNTYMGDETQAWLSYTKGQLFTFVQQGPSESTVIIKVPSENSYLCILNSGLTTTLYERDKTIFQILPANGSPTKFNIYANIGNNTLPLVTPNSVEPFKFFIQSRYPHEPIANFSLTSKNVELTYAGKRENIENTLIQIRNRELGDKSEAYSKLTTLMQSLNHTEGKEIFLLGIYIKEDLGLSDRAFLQLPLQVQQIVSGVPVRLGCYRGSDYYQIKYVTASSMHVGIILPYTFEYSHTLDKWAITYGGDHQLYIPDYNYNLLEIVSSNKEYQFELRWEKSGRGFFVYNIHSSNPLVAYTDNPAFNFHTEWSSQSTLFLVLYYDS